MLDTGSTSLDDEQGLRMTASGRIDQHDAGVVVPVREGEYGNRVGTVEPGGRGVRPARRPAWQPVVTALIWTSPNLEFATVFVGVLAIARRAA